MYNIISLIMPACIYSSSWHIRFTIYMIYYSMYIMKAYGCACDTKTYYHIIQIYFATYENEDAHRISII